MAAAGAGRVGGAAQAACAAAAAVCDRAAIALGATQDRGRDGEDAYRGTISNHPMTLRALGRDFNAHSIQMGFVKPNGVAFFRCSNSIGFDPRAIAMTQSPFARSSVV